MEKKKKSALKKAGWITLGIGLCVAAGWFTKKYEEPLKKGTKKAGKKVKDFIMPPRVMNECQQTMQQETLRETWRDEGDRRQGRDNNRNNNYRRENRNNNNNNR